jgi:hypothetical protein
MTSKAKKQLSGGNRSPTQRRPSAQANKQLEAYLLSREILRRIRRTTLHFVVREGKTSITGLH